MDWSKLIRSELTPMKPYEPGLREEQVREYTQAEIIRKLSSNENPYGPFSAAIEAMTHSLTELNRYPDGSCYELVNALSDFHGIACENIVVGNGSNELLCLIGQAILEPDDEIVYAWPSFIVYPMMAQVASAQAVEVPLTPDFRHDLEAMLAAITEKTKIVILCNPNNPTGTIYTRDEFANFMDRVPDHVLVVVDEAYIEYVTNPEFPDAKDWFDRKRPLAIFRTFSKIYSMAGVRCGYGFVPAPLAEAISKVREPFNVNSVAQAGALASLHEQDEVRKRRAEAFEQREHLANVFEELGLRYCPSQTNFIWVEVSEGKRVFGELLREGIIVRDFGASTFLRVGVGCPDDTQCTVNAFKSLHKQGKL